MHADQCILPNFGTFLDIFRIKKKNPNSSYFIRWTALEICFFHHKINQYVWDYTGIDPQYHFKIEAFKYFPVWLIIGTNLTLRFYACFESKTTPTHLTCSDI